MGLALTRIKDQILHIGDERLLFVGWERVAGSWYAEFERIIPTVKDQFRTEPARIAEGMRRKVGVANISVEKHGQQVRMEIQAPSDVLILRDELKQRGFK